MYIYLLNCQALTLNLFFLNKECTFILKTKLALTNNRYLKTIYASKLVLLKVYLISVSLRS